MRLTASFSGALLAGGLTMAAPMLAGGVFVALGPVARAATAAATPFTPQAFSASQAEGKPILVEIDASWCPTCAKQRPIIQKLVHAPERYPFLEGRAGRQPTGTERTADPLPVDDRHDAAPARRAADATIGGGRARAAHLPLPSTSSRSVTCMSVNLRSRFAPAEQRRPVDKKRQQGRKRGSDWKITLTEALAERSKNWSRVDQPNDLKNRREQVHRRGATAVSGEQVARRIVPPRR